MATSASDGSGAGIRNENRYYCLDARFNDWHAADGPADLSSVADDCANLTNSGGGDSVSDYVYYLDWAGATTLPPEPPTPLSPLDHAFLTDPRPVLVIRNSTHSGSAALTYFFQVSTQETFLPIWKRGDAIVEGSETTSWQVPTPLTVGNTYYWRARSFDGTHYSLWTETFSFQAVSTIPNSTTTPTLSPTRTSTATPAATQTPTAVASSTPTVARTTTPTPSRTPTVTGTPQPGRIEVLIFRDINSNALQNSGENPVAGIPIILLNLAGETVRQL